MPLLSRCLLAAIPVLTLIEALVPGAASAQAPSDRKRDSLPRPAQVVPLEGEKEFWSRKAGLLRYQCRDMELHAQSRFSPSTRFLLSKGPFNAKDCSTAVESLESKGCFCDEAKLTCLEMERIEPATYLCNGDLKCLVFEGKKKGVLKVVMVGDHITRKKCELELADVERP